MKWYALFVETGQEEKLKQLINTVYPDDDIKILIPQRKLKERRQGKTYEVVKTVSRICSHKYGYGCRYVLQDIKTAYGVQYSER